MILELPKLTQKEYDKRKEDFYKKPGIPDIELELEGYQKELLLKENYGILPKMHERLAVYAKSLILQALGENKEFIDPAIVDSLSDQAADNFIKRYFRTEDPVVGASFAGILTYKVKEVLSAYFKGTAIESNVSLDTELSNDTNNSLTVEQLLAFKEYNSNHNAEDGYDFTDRAEEIYERIERECSLLKKVNLEKDLDKLFLQYLIYLYILQSSRMDRKLTSVSSQALRLIAVDENQLARITPILESAFLDVTY